MGNKESLSNLKPGEYLYGFESDRDFGYDKGYIPKGRYLVKAKVLKIDYHYFGEDIKKRNIHDHVILYLDFNDHKKDDIQYRVELQIPRISFEESNSITVNRYNGCNYFFYTRYNTAKRKVIDMWKNCILNLEYDKKAIQNVIDKIKKDKSEQLDLTKV